MKLRLVLEYDGAKFHGWQSQPEVNTVQEELSLICSRVLSGDIVNVVASGRTDAGVHAAGQVVHLEVRDDLDVEKFVHGINSLMQGNLAVIFYDQVPEEFHARFSASRKQYVYTIFNSRIPPVLQAPYCWHVTQVLNLDLMNEACTNLIGEHDFSSFQGQGCSAKSAVRQIYEAELEKSGNCLKFRVVGNGFLKHMVRNIVGTLVEMGGCKINGSMSDIIGAKDRTKAGITAPAQGLRLDHVEYPDFPFIIGDKRVNYVTSCLLGRSVFGSVSI